MKNFVTLHPTTTVMMKKTKTILTRAIAFSLLFLAVLFAGCDDGGKEASSAEAIRMLNEASNARNYERMLFLADSLGKAGDLSDGESYYWQGFAYYRMKQRRTAEFYWKESMNATEHSTDAEDLAVYARSASYLAGLHIRYLNFTSALKVVKPALEKLDQQEFTANSDYTNLLIFAGCCQAHFNIQDSVVNDLFERAYQRHMDNINASHAKESYRDAVVGVINIAYGWLSEKRYDQGLTWTERLGSLVEDYKDRYADDEAYIDKQWARYIIFKAIGLEGLGRMEEAEKAFASYQETRFSQTFEGQVDASDYLMMAGHWQEAADNLSNLDKLFASEQAGASLEDIQKNWLKKYHAHAMAGQQDTANVVANQICQRLDSAIIKSQWVDAEEQEVIQQKEEQILQQQERLSNARIMALIAAFISISIFFAVYTVIRHRAERKLAQANAQLEQKNEQLLVANARAEESSRMKTDFIQQISHEIRTPLNILSGFTQIVTTPGMELDDDTKQDINRQITENTDRITGLVNKMLELSEANSQTVLERNDQIPAIQIAAQAVDAAGITQAQHLVFDLQVTPEAEAVMLQTNLTAATRALSLLLDNAQKFTRPAEAKLGAEQTEKQANVLLQISTDVNRILFTVEDTGIGVPAAEAEHIFEEFVQLDEYYDGTGIGLTVARSLARRLGGDVYLDTTYTPGARFVMTLPQE